MRQLTEQSTSESGPPENSIDDRTVASFVRLMLLSINAKKGTKTPILFYPLNFMSIVNLLLFSHFTK